jgi:hypothetical protein
MSLHISVVAIRGDHTGRAGDLLRLFGYKAEDGPIEVTGWDAAARHLGDHSCKAVYFRGFAVSGFVFGSSRRSPDTGAVLVVG